jgi:hypothetical protein
MITGIFLLSEIFDFRLFKGTFRIPGFSLAFPMEILLMNTVEL